MKVRRILIICAIIIGAILFVLTVLCLAWNYSLNKQLDRELESIKNKNEPVLYEALIPPLVSDEQNAFLVYKKILQGPAFSDLTNQYNDRFDLACDVIAGLKPETPENIQEVSYLVYDNSVLIDALSQAGLMGKCRVDIDYSKANTSSPFPSYAGRVRDAFRLLQGAVLVKLLNNQPKDAIKILDTEIEMLRLWEPPCLMTMAMELGAYRDILGSAKRIIKSQGSDETLMQEILQRVARLNPTERFHRDFSAYRAENISYIEKLILSDFKGVGDVFDVSWLDRVFYSSSMGHLFLKAEKVYYLKMMRQLIETYSQPPYQTKLLRERISREIESTPFYLPIARLFLSGLDDFFAKQFYMDTKIILTKTAILLTMYKLRKGTYPDGLNDLPDDLLKRLPKDPFSGEDFIYRKKDGGFILYSIGPNYKDDGGVSKPSDNKDDIAW